MKSKGHTLWLIPTGEAHNKYSNLIKKLAKEYNSPVFEPHVTLLGEFLNPVEDCIEKTKQLVAGQQPFIIKMNNIGCQDYFWRTLFVYAEKSPQLQALHDKAKKIFNMELPPFMPHLSLLYGMFPQVVKDKIIKEIGKSQLAEFKVDKVILKKGGEIKDWKIISEFPLLFRQ